MTLRDDLVAAKALIETPEKWSPKGAITGHGICAWIALHRAINTTGQRLMAAYDALYYALPWRWRFRALICRDLRDAWIIRFNDHHSVDHADIMALFDRAIASALAKPEPAQ